MGSALLLGLVPLGGVAAGGGIMPAPPPPVVVVELTEGVAMLSL